MAVNTSTWVWYDPKDRYVLASGSPTNFSRSVQNGPGVQLDRLTENAFWTEVNGDNRIEDRDGQDGGGGAFNAPIGEGLTIDGRFSQLSTYAVFPATVTAADGRTIANLALAAYQFPDTTIAFRLEDTAIQALSLAGIGRGAIQAVTITGGPVHSRGVTPSGHDDAFPCYTPGTLIETDAGPRPVESLRAGDRVWTRDHGFQPVLWAGIRCIALPADGSRDHLRPVRIAPGILDRAGGGLLVSPQHRILLHSRIAQRMFGTMQVLVPAKALLDLPGVTLATGIACVTYVHFACASHQIVRANGVLSESLYLGSQALLTLGAAARAEIAAIFPGLDSPVPAARLVGVAQARSLIARHRRNGRPVLAA